MTAVLERDWIDELVDWQLKQPEGLYTNEMFELRDDYEDDTDADYSGGATWSPKYGWREVDWYGNPHPDYDLDHYARPLQVIPVKVAV